MATFPLELDARERTGPGGGATLAMVGVFVDLFRLVPGCSPLPELVAEIERLALLAVPAARSAALVLGAPDAPGPALEAFRTSAVVLVGDAGSDGPVDVAVPVRSVLSVAVIASDRTLGVLTLTSPGLDAFDAGDIVIAGALAEGVGAILLTRERADALTRTAEQLREALTSRAIIDQAKGIVMGGRGVGPDEAFAVLAQISQERNVKLRVVAQEFVDAKGAFSEP